MLTWIVIQNDDLQVNKPVENPWQGSHHLSTC